MALVVLSVVASSCGNSGGGITTSASASVTIQGNSGNKPIDVASPGGQIKSDGDADNPKDLDGNPDPDGAADQDDDSYTPESRRYPDADDKITFAYGKAPTLADRRKIASVVARYYAAAAAADGATACSLFGPVFRQAVPEDYAGSAGPPYLRGYKTCAAVLSHVFAHDPRLHGVKVRVLSVRIEGDVAQAVFGSAATPASRLFLQRLNHRWYLESLLGSPLP